MNNKLDDLYKMAKKKTQTTQTDSGWNRKSTQTSNKDGFSNKFFLTIVIQWLHWWTLPNV